MSMQLFKNLEELKQQYDDTFDEIKPIINKYLIEYLSLPSVEKKLEKNNIFFNNYDNKLDLDDYYISDFYQNKEFMITINIAHYTEAYYSRSFNRDYAEINIPVKFFIDETYRNQCHTNEEIFLEEKRKKEAFELQKKEEEKRNKEYQYFLTLKNKYETKKGV